MCKSCLPGYYLSPKEYTDSNADYYRFGTCEPCPEEFCTCKTPTLECSGCISLLGYYWNSVNKTCVNCQSNCKTCKNADTCSVCDDGYYLDTTTGACSVCTGNCFTCTFTSEVEKCNKDKCFNGFYFDTDTSECLECL